MLFWISGASQAYFGSLKSAWTYCNERDQPAAKECNRKLYYRQKLFKKNIFCASKNGTLTVSDHSTTRVPKSSRGFLELSIWNDEKY